MVAIPKGTFIAEWEYACRADPPKSPLERKVGWFQSLIKWRFSMIGR